jgi:hypothetical protein
MILLERNCRVAGGIQDLRGIPQPQAPRRREARLPLILQTVQLRDPSICWKGMDADSTIGHGEPAAVLAGGLAS